MSNSNTYMPGIVPVPVKGINYIIVYTDTGCTKFRPILPIKISQQDSSMGELILYSYLNDLRIGIINGPINSHYTRENIFKVKITFQISISLTPVSEYISDWFYDIKDFYMKKY